MEDAREDLVLNPAVTWTRMGEDRLLLRMPDGEQVTFDRDVEAITEVLGLLSASNARTTAQKPSIYPEVVAFLRERGLVGARSLLPAERDWLLEHVAFLRARSGNENKFTCCALRGSGWVLERARCALEGANIERVGSVHEPGALTVVATDWDDIAFFRVENDEAVRNGYPITFVRRTGMAVISGPLVLPGQSACFECYFQRAWANTSFPAEFSASVQLASAQREQDSGPRSSLGAGLLEYAIARHVVGAMHQVLEMSEAGVIESFDAATLRVMRQRVLKVPRCRTCGRRASKPQRTIRDLA